MENPKDKGVTVFPRQEDKVSVMWGGCGLFQELQAMRETPECWGCSQETNCSSFTASIARVMAGRMTLLENIPLQINGGIETPGRRRGLASKKWLCRKKKVIWYTSQRSLFRSRNVLVPGPVSLWFPIALLSLEWLPLGEQLRSPWKEQIKQGCAPVPLPKTMVLDSKQSPLHYVNSL